MRKNKMPHVWGSFLRKRDIVRYCADYDIQIFRFVVNRNTFLTRFVFRKSVILLALRLFHSELFPSLRLPG